MELQTERLILTPASAGFVQAILDRDCVKAGALHQITVPPTWPGSREALDGLSWHLRAMQADPNEVPWRIHLVILKDDRIAIGSVNLKGAPKNGEVEIGWGVLPSKRRKGFETEAVGAMIDWLDQQPEVQRVTATIDDTNTASVRVAQRYGFRKTSEIRRELPVYERLSSRA
jgi:ribosomal-protein-alanine N-acetyltransferase